MPYKITPKNKKETKLLVDFLKTNRMSFSKPRKQGTGQAKGRSFEKEIAKELSFWWTAGDRDDVFYCTAGSGSRFTVRKKFGKDTANSCGDIGLIHSVGQPFLDVFSVEIKRGYSNELDILNIIDSRGKSANQTLLSWVEKAVMEIKQAHRPEYMLIFKRDHKTKVVCVQSSLIEKLQFAYEKTDFEKEIVVYKDTYGICMIDYVEFFTKLKPKDFLGCYDPTATPIEKVRPKLKR